MKYTLKERFELFKMRYSLKECLLWFLILGTFICAIITCINSFDNEREYYTIEKIDEIQLQLNNIEEHLRYIEIKLEENIYELD